MLVNKILELPETSVDIEDDGPGHRAALGAAVASGRKDLLELLLKAGANFQGRSGWDALHIVVLQNDIPAVKLLIQYGCPKQMVLRVAAELGNFEIANMFLKQSIDVTSPLSFRNETCYLLHVAVHGGNVAVVRALLRAGADPRAVDENQQTPFLQAILERDSRLEMLKQLLYKGAATHSLANGRQALHVVAKVCWRFDLPESEELLHCLIDNGANIQARDKKGMTPALVAASARNVQALQTLLRLGSAIDGQDSRGRGFLHVLLDRLEDRDSFTDEWTGILDVLFAENVDTLHKDQDGATPIGRLLLRYACNYEEFQDDRRWRMDGSEEDEEREDHQKLVDYLTQMADPSKPAPPSTILMEFWRTIRNKNVRSTGEKLMERMVSKDPACLGCMNLLQAMWALGMVLAATLGDALAVETLLAMRTHYDIPSKNLEAGLLCATAKGDAQIVKQIVHFCPTIDHDEITEMWASSHEQGGHAILAILLEEPRFLMDSLMYCYLSKPMKKSSWHRLEDGYTADIEQCLKMMLDAGLKCDTEFANDSAMLIAARLNWQEAMELFIEHGADLLKCYSYSDRYRWQGGTALQQAARSGYLSMMKLILDRQPQTLNQLD